MNKSMRYILLVLLAYVLLAFTACSQSDTATVTIDTGLRQQVSAGPIPLLDRVLAFLSFSARAQADPPIGLSIERITVTISGPGMTTLNGIEIPLDTGKKTIEVPAGVDRTFTVIGWQYSGQGDIYFRDFGGVETTDLSPGASVELTIHHGTAPAAAD